MNSHYGAKGIKREHPYPPDPHLWSIIGENTGGYVYWCGRCGCVSEEAHDGAVENVRVALMAQGNICQLNRS